MLNFRYCDFTKPSCPATIIAADGVRAHDVAVVVDLDPLRRAVEAEGLGEPVEQRRLAGALGHPPGQRLARVTRCVLDQSGLLAAPRHRDRHLAPERGGQASTSRSQLSGSWLASTSRGGVLLP